jgi:outer membrane protein TolC
MNPQRVAALLLLGLAGLPYRLPAQTRAVTLADAIRLSERVQPLVVRASGDLETAAAQRRSAWGAYLPSLTATSSASSFFSEGTSRIDPVTGQLLTGNSSNRSLSTSLSASVDLFTGFRRGAEGRAARATQTAAEASFVDARYQQALATTNQFLDALAAQQLVGVRESSVRRAEEQLKTRGIGVIITDHNVRETLSICDHAYIITDGHIIREGTPREIAADPQVREIYLGENFSL